MDSKLCCHLTTKYAEVFCAVYYFPRTACLVMLHPLHNPLIDIESRLRTSAGFFFSPKRIFHLHIQRQTKQYAYIYINNTIAGLYYNSSLQQAAFNGQQSVSFCHHAVHVYGLLAYRIRFSAGDV